VADPKPPQPRAVTPAQIRALSRFIEGRRPPLESMDELERLKAKQKLGLRDKYAKQILVLLWVQIVAMNLIFVAYAHVGVDWKVPNSVMLAWVGSIVADLIGVVLIIVKYLFEDDT
jgi:hypothetical protein